MERCPQRTNVVRAGLLFSVLVQNYFSLSSEVRTFLT